MTRRHNDEDAKERAKTVVDTFKTFIEKNKDELIAVQIIYNKPYESRQITYVEIKRLTEAIEKPPYNLTSELVWQAYEQLEKSKVRETGAQKLLTNIISLVRFAMGDIDVLEPYYDLVDHRFKEWIVEQEKTGKMFTGEQREWLELIKEHIATSLSIEMEDFEFAPFYEKGGAVKVYQLFGDELDSLLGELNEVLVA